MKRILYAATLALTSFTAIPVILVGTSFYTTAYAAEESCEPTATAASTGGLIQQRIDAIAHCQPNSSTESMTQTSDLMQKASHDQADMILVKPQNQIDKNRLFCPSIPLQASPDDLQYKQALERCKYGAGS